MVSVEPPELAPAPLSSSSPPPQAANASATSAAAAAPTILLCMSPLPGQVVQGTSVVRGRCRWQAIQAGLNAADARLLGGRPRADAICLLTAMGGGREPAHAPGPRVGRCSRALYGRQRGAPGGLRHERAAAPRVARWIHPGL